MLSAPGVNGWCVPQIGIFFLPCTCSRRLCRVLCSIQYLVILSFLCDTQNLPKMSLMEHYLNLYPGCAFPCLTHWSKTATNSDTFYCSLGVSTKCRQFPWRAWFQFNAVNKHIIPFSFVSCGRVRWLPINFWVPYRVVCSRQSRASTSRPNSTTQRPIESPKLAWWKPIAWVTRKLFRGQKIKGQYHRVTKCKSIDASCF